jgi:hypothetical protein
MKLDVCGNGVDPHRCCTPKNCPDLDCKATTDGCGTR